MRGYSRYFWFIHFLGDLILINFSFLVSYFYKFGSLIDDDRYFFLLLIFNFIWIFTAFMLDLYAIKRLRRVDRILFNLMRAGVINIFAIAALLFSLNDDSPFSADRNHIHHLLIDKDFNHGWASFFAVMYCSVLTLICFFLIEYPNLSFFIMVGLALLFIILPMASFARSTTKKFLSFFK